MKRCIRNSCIAMQVVFLLCLVGCDKPSKRDLAILVSPDKRVKAALVEVGGPATVGFAYEVQIRTKKGTTDVVAILDKVQSKGGGELPMLRWRDAKTLIISFAKARVFRYTNFWQRAELDNFATTYEIRLEVTEKRGIPYP